jgi:hypothetical protein
VVVLDVPAGGLEIAIALIAGGPVAVVEDVELELGRHLGGVALLLEPTQLSLEHRARAVGQLFAVMVGHVAQHQGRPGQPRDAPQRPEVRLDDEIAIALRPGRRLEARHRLHLHVDGQEIVAGVPFLVHRLEEVASGHPLADQPALHIGERGHHRVDLAARHQGLELRLFQPA